MSHPQHITRDIGGSIWIDLTTRPSTVTVDVLTSTGTAIVSAAAASVSSVNTTLSAACSQGATTITVASATGISNGSVLWLRDDPESILVYRISGTTCYLRRPLLMAHVSGASLVGTRCSYTVSSTNASTCWYDGRAKWTIDDRVEYTAVECTRYPLKRHAGAQHLFDRNPKLFEILDPEVDVERLLDDGHDEVLMRIGARRRAMVFTGSDEFIRATCVAALMLYYEHMPSSDGTTLYERYRSALDGEIDRVIATVPADEDQDGVVETSDKPGWRAIAVRR